MNYGYDNDESEPTCKYCGEPDLGFGHSCQGTRDHSKRLEESFQKNYMGHGKMAKGRLIIDFECPDTQQGFMQMLSDIECSIPFGEMSHEDELLKIKWSAEVK